MNILKNKFLIVLVFVKRDINTRLKNQKENIIIKKKPQKSNRSFLFTKCTVYHVNITFFGNHTLQYEK